MRALLILAPLLSLCWSAQAQELPEAPRVARRHIVFLREGVDSVFGNYIFAVENPSGAAAPFKATVMLPKETVDFGATEGIEPQDVRLDGESVVVERSFPAGVHIVGIAFKADGSFGRTTLTFKVSQEIENLSLLVPKQGTMGLESSALQAAGDSETPDEEYRPYVNKAPLKPGDTFTVSVSGLPEGRGRLWIIGSVIAGLMVLLASVLALRTRPKIKDDGGESFLVN